MTVHPLPEPGTVYYDDFATIFFTNGFTPAVTVNGMTTVAGITILVHRSKVGRGAVGVQLLPNTPPQIPTYVTDSESRNPFRHADPQGRKDICKLISAGAIPGENAAMGAAQSLAKRLSGNLIPFVSEASIALDTLAGLMYLSGEGCGKYAGD